MTMTDEKGSPAGGCLQILATPTIAEDEADWSWETVDDIIAHQEREEKIKADRLLLELREENDRLAYEVNMFMIDTLRELGEDTESGRIKKYKTGTKLDGRKPAPARQLPSPSLPQDVARAIVNDYPAPLTWWRGDFYVWTGTHWETEVADVIRSWVRRITESATYIKLNAKNEPEEARWAPTIRKVNEVTMALGEGVLRRDGDADTVLALANGVLVDGLLVPHSTDNFNLASLPFEFDPIAEPRQWLRFLDSSLPNDPAAHDFLQEWFGYVLSGRTDIQMMASLIGKPRAGKGTIARVLEAMVGTNHTTGVTLEQLGSQFGLAGLVGKSLATISEPRWASRQAGEVVEPLLNIVGGDRITVDRKYAQQWIGRLGVRFMILSNETPRLVNRTGALASRMTHVRFPVSFVGREDYGLEERLLTELPGILNWALIGLKRLDANGRFTVPETHQGIQEQFMEYADQDAGFLDAKCVLGPDLSATEAEVYDAYQAWCLEAGRRHDSTTSMTLRHRLGERDGITARRQGRAKRWVLSGLTVPGHVEPFDQE